jgi:hypothetical protein
VPVPLDPLPADLLMRPLRRLLKPLVRLLILTGVTFPVLSELLRGLYVSEAVDGSEDSRSPLTDSRVSLVTGLTRREVRRLRQMDPNADPIPAVITRSSEVIARWLGSEIFALANGSPAPLRRLRNHGEPSFESLVESVTRDVRPRTLLDDFLKQNIVRMDAQNRIHLNVVAFVPEQGKEEQLFFFGRNLHDHIAAACANITADGPPPFTERTLHYDRLRPATAERLEKTAREMALKMLTDLNRIALRWTEQDDRLPDTDEVTKRVNLGVFVYSETESDVSET